jgi:hypothetical protein
MGRAKAVAGLLGVSLTMSGCETFTYYYRTLKTGDAYILVLIGSLAFMMILFGTISRSRQEILDEGVTKVQFHKDSIHAAEDEIRLKREALYRTQQELIAVYDSLLTDAQRKKSELVAKKRRMLELEREILAAEGKRNTLTRQ